MREGLEKTGERCRQLLGKYRYAMLVLALGVFFMALPTARSGPPSHEPDGPPTVEDRMEGLEERLEAVLSQIRGAGRTRVVLTLETGDRRILAQDMDRDQEGAGRTKVVTLGRGSGKEEVVPLQTVAPSFRGALVVCVGGEDPEVQLRIVKAVGALTGLRSDQICVCGS